MADTANEGAQVLMPSEVSTRVGVFDRFAGVAAVFASRAYFFAFCVLLIVVWAPSYFIIGDLDTWQLIINTATTIITFLMVFVIQNTQNRDAKAIHLKLDELIRGVKGARTEMVALETCTDEELAAFQKDFERLHERLSKRAAVAAHAAKVLRHGPAADGVAE
jgi:low affinity Fe/Cu permease